MGGLQDKCSVVVTHNLHDTHSFMDSLKHRGRDTSGIAAVGEDRIDVVKWAGTPKEVDLEDLVNMFPQHEYHTFMGHSRYTTSGGKERLLEDAHPVTIGGEVEHRGNHILEHDCDMAAVHNGETAFRDMEGTDTRGLLEFYKRFGEIGLLERVEGAYTVAIADRRKKDVLAIRDRTGIKPGVLGVKDGSKVIASEDIALRKNGGTMIENMDPGSVYYLTPDGDMRREKVADSDLSECVFEYLYLAHADSIVNGHSVRNLRIQLGRELARNVRIDDADFVTYIPRCPEPAARAYAQDTDTEFLHAFYKLDAERAFMGPDAEERHESIQKNMFVNPRVAEKMKGGVVGVVDDSLVRGNNAKYTRHLLYDVIGVERAELMLYTPPIGIIAEDGIPRGCEYGVDMPPDDDFLARGRTAQEMEDEVGMPIHYLSLDNMLGVISEEGVPTEDLCYFCMGGERPFPKQSSSDLVQLRRE